MKRKTSKNLKLKSQTLRALDTQTLVRVNGGESPEAPTKGRFCDPG